MKHLKNLRYRHYLQAGIVFSLTFNFILLTIYYEIALFSDNHFLAVTALFISVYLFLLLPAKDYVISRWIIQVSHRSRASLSRLNERIHMLENTNDVLSFLQDFLRRSNRREIRLYTIVPRREIYLVKKKGESEAAALSSTERDWLLATLTPSASLDSLRNYNGPMAAMYSACSIVPVFFRDRLLAAIISPEKLNTEQYDLLENLARQLSVILESSELRKKNPRSELLSREFSAARAVGELLARSSDIECCGKIFRRIPQGWQDKYFNAMFEVAYPEVQTTKRNFLLLARLSSSAIRANSLQLFIAQGYFNSVVFSLAPEQTLWDLAEQFNDLLFSQENGKISLDGIIAEIREEEDDSLIVFGKKISLNMAGQRTLFEKSVPMGLGYLADNPLIPLPNTGIISIGLSNYDLLQIVPGATP